MINPKNPNGGGIRNAMAIPIPAKIIPSLVHSGHPPVEQEAPLFEEDSLSIRKQILLIFIIISVKKLSHIILSLYSFNKLLIWIIMLLKIESERFIYLKLG